MLRNTASRAAVTGVALLLVAAAAAAAPLHTNLLANPDFEETLPGHPWMPVAWDTSAAALGTVFFGRDTFLVEHGRYAISLASVSTLYPMAHNWSQGLVVGPEAWGKDVELTVWTRSNGLQGRAFILVQAYRDTVTKMAHEWKVSRDEAGQRLHINLVDDPLIALGWKRQYFSENETGWVKRSVRVYVPPSTNVLYARLGLTGTGQVLFDDASLELLPAAPPPPVPLRTNLLKDPGFEGDGNDWEYSLPPYENLEVVRDTTVSHSGRASIRMEGGLDGMIQVRTGVGQVFSNRALGGKHVRLSGYVKADSLKGLAYLMIYAHTPNGAKMEPAPKQYSMNVNWEHAVTEMDLPKDTYSLWVWFCYNAPATGRLYFDDCSLEVTGPARGAPGAPPRAKPAKR